MSKFILNLQVQILKLLPNSKIYLNSKIKTLLIFFLWKFAQLAQAATLAYSFPGYRLPHLTQQSHVLRQHTAWFLPPSQ
jgi:hypothetical protein